METILHSVGRIVSVSITGHPWLEVFTGECRILDAEMKGDDLYISVVAYGGRNPPSAGERREFGPDGVAWAPK